MPGSVRVARGMMWVAVVLVVCAGLALVGLLGQYTDELPQSAKLLLAILGGVAIASVVLIGVLAAKMSSRRRWVRITILVLETLNIGTGLLSLVNEFNAGTLFGIGYAAVIVALLCTDDARVWFDR